MQQRARMLGGDLVARPAEQGFLVSARLPVEDTDREQRENTHHGNLRDPDMQLVENPVP
jgi:hypothetical protein